MPIDSIANGNCLGCSADLSGDGYKKHCWRNYTQTI